MLVFEAWKHYLSGNFSTAMLAQVPAAYQLSGEREASVCVFPVILIKQRLLFREVGSFSWFPLSALSPDYTPCKGG